MPCSGPRTLSRLAFGIARVRFCQRVRIELDDCVQLRSGIIDCRDSLEVGLGQLVTAEFAVGHPGLQGFDVCFDESEFALRSGL